MIKRLRVDGIYKRKNDYFVCEYVDKESFSYLFRNIKTGIATRIRLSTIRYIGTKEDFIEYFV